MKKKMTLATHAQWYVATSFSGNEQKVVDNIINKAKSNDVYEAQSSNPKIASVRILTTKFIRVTPTGREKEVEKNIYPGYIFIRMIMDDETWFMVRNTPGVTGFVGSSGKGAKPFPITDIEISTLLEQKEITEQAEKTAEESPVLKKVYETTLKIGDEAIIIEGPFSGQTGIIMSLDSNKGISNIQIEFFGRLTNVEIPFSDIQETAESLKPDSSKTGNKTVFVK